MRYIYLKGKLGNGKKVAVDNDQYTKVNSFRWNLYGNRYAATKIKGKLVYMHALINCTPPGLVTDHINRDTLDNRKNNLRSVSKSQNAMNTKLRNNNTTGHTGVSKNGNYFDPNITIGGKTIHLGVTKTLEEAIGKRKSSELFYAIS